MESRAQDTFEFYTRRRKDRRVAVKVALQRLRRLEQDRALEKPVDKFMQENNDYER